MRFGIMWKILPGLLVLIAGAGCGGKARGNPELSPLREAELPDRVNVYYFYDGLCQSCNGTAEFDEAAETQLAGLRDRFPYAIHRINVFLKGNRDLYQGIIDSLGLDGNALELPLLIVGGQVFSGNERIARNLRKAFLSAGEDLFVQN
ncbi:MAG: hypothetical protein LBP20_04085 [Treponema sp.]|jgi:hypothetical protein|nr:hypothetical protein [Treponema sp.]